MLSCSIDNPEQGSLFSVQVSIIMECIPGHAKAQDSIMMRISVESHAVPTRLQMGLWGVLMVITLALLLYDWSGYQVGTYGDDGSYVSVTDSLLYQGNYGMFLDPGETEPTQFPFVYPLMLAPLRAWFPDNLNALRIVSLVSTLVLLTVLFWGWRRIGRGLSYWWGLALTAVVALSPVTILHGRTVMSEAVFLCFVLLLVFWIEYVVERSPRGWGLLLGVIAVGTVYSRTVGWAFLIPALAYLIWKMRGLVWRQLGVAAATMTVLVSIIVATTTVQPVDLLPQEYMAQLSWGYDSRNRKTAIITDPANGEQAVPPPAFSYPDVVRQLHLNLLEHLDIADKLPFQMEKAVIDATNAVGAPFLRYIPILGAIAVVALGVVVWIRRTGVTLLLVVAPAYIAMLMIWAWNGSRLAYPVQPQLFLALMLGVYAVGAWLTARVFGGNRRLLAVASTALLLMWLGVWVWLDLRLTQTMLLPGDQVSRAALLQQYIPPDAVVISTRAETDFLYSPQRFIKVPRARQSLATIRSYMLDHHVDYLILPVGVTSTRQVEKLRIGKMTRFLLYVEPLIKAQALVELYSNAPDDLAIYRVDRAMLTGLETTQAP